MADFSCIHWKGENMIQVGLFLHLELFLSPSSNSEGKILRASANTSRFPEENRVGKHIEWVASRDCLSKSKGGQTIHLSILFLCVREVSLWLCQEYCCHLEIRKKKPFSCNIIQWRTVVAWYYKHAEKCCCHRALRPSCCLFTML
jgi:hypothetical protein